MPDSVCSRVRAYSEGFFFYLTAHLTYCKKTGLRWHQVITTVSWIQLWSMVISVRVRPSSHDHHGCGVKVSHVKGLPFVSFRGSRSLTSLRIEKQQTVWECSGCYIVQDQEWQPERLWIWSPIFRRWLDPFRYFYKRGAIRGSSVGITTYNNVYTVKADIGLGSNERISARYGVLYIGLYRSIVARLKPSVKTAVPCYFMTTFHKIPIISRWKNEQPANSWAKVPQFKKLVRVSYPCFSAGGTLTRS